jgi:hypothetical protein
VAIPQYVGAKVGLANPRPPCWLSFTSIPTPERAEALLEIMLDYQGRPSFMVPDGQGHRVPWLTAEKKREG